MKEHNFDYQNIESFQTKYKDKANSKCRSKKCYKYYLKQTQYDKNYSLQQTFKYIDSFYKQYEEKHNTTASKKFNSTNYLLSRLTNLEYQSKNSFSILSSIIISLFISFFVAALQTDEGGTNFFKLFNDAMNVLKINMLNSANPLQIMVIVLCIIIIFFMFTIMIFLIILLLSYVSQSIFEMNSFYKINIMPYEMKVITNTLGTYDSRYKE